MIDFSQVSLRYGKGPEILKDVSFSLPQGSFHFLLGSSGAGKTSLLKMMHFSLKPSRGIINMSGRDISGLSSQERSIFRRKIGVVYQDYRLLPHLTAFNNVALPLRVSGASEEHIQNHVMELMRWVGLADHVNAKPTTMSGGQQQRLAFARAVITRPNLLLADEPTGSVDAKSAKRLFQLFRDLHSLGTTIFIATHSMELVREFGHPSFRLENGQLYPPS